ncbi:hypothetical protein [Nonomuraea harbinensis]|uniref:WXG100 family type VII secretion target n=1 Tax=Nonomuraea harbinensis TaxID=1286938 RepID=A0ABW1BS86_9ACTN|nr:hypothetical protein [Nonomuraea harbinensis]
MNGKDAFSAAAMMSLTAAVMIAQPWAFYVAAAFGTLVSNPEGMDDSATNWRSTDQNGVTTELNKLVEELEELKTQLKEDGKWEGGAFQSFSGVHGSFVESIGQLKNIRDETGNAVSSTADFMKIVSYIVLAIAGVMLAWGIFCFATRWHPVSAVTVYGMSAALGKAILAATKKIVASNWKKTAILAGIMFLAVQYTQMTGQMFPTVDPIPSEMSVLNTGDPTSMRQPFTNDGLVYDEDTGQLRPDTNLQV